jgi:hypothetical protein
MTKAENRAAAKAYQEEKQRRWREEAHAAAVAADLERLGALRKYLIFNRKVAVPGRELIDAIGGTRAIENGWLKLHESGTFVTFTQAGADLFA